MNFAEKFDGFLPSVDAYARGQVHVDSVSAHAPPGAIVVNDAQLLFTGDFKRSGLDLVLSKDDRELVLHDYFKGEKRAALASPDGAHLTGDIVGALTGHTQYAQAGGAPDAAKIIGHVTKLAGNATAIRNGVAIVLNQGDNVYKSDVVQSGSDSTLGITFIDGTVFGLGANAKMVLNEMIYDPNGSNNSSLMSLVQGTISFVAGQTAKHGDMKVDTPVATMGIRGTAVLVEIDFAVPGQGGAPPAKFQVLVEPDGTTGSYILFDKTTLNPIATVNQAGTQTIVNGQGTVSFLSSAQLSGDAQKIISDVFALKFTDNTNPNTKLTTNFTDTVIPISTSFKLANGDIVTPTIFLLNFADNSTPQGNVVSPKARDHIPGPPTVVTENAAFTEKVGVTHDASADTITGKIKWADINPGDTPSGSVSFASFAYKDAHHNDVTSSLTSEQLAAISAVAVPLVVEQDPGNLNIGSATWTYSLADGAFDFLAAGETLTLTYLARVDNNFQLNNEIGFKTFTITITGTNDAPTVSTTGGVITERVGTGNTAIDTVTGTVTFTDVDLTDRPVVSTVFSSFAYLDSQGHDVTATLTAKQLAAIKAVEVPLSVVQAAGNTHNGSASWTYSIQDKAFDFIAKGEKLTLVYVATVDDGHGGVVSTPITVSISGADVSVDGTNDVPVITSGVQAAAITEAPDTTSSVVPDTAGGAVTFTDPDLTDTHAVTVTGVTASGVTTGLAGHPTVLSWLTLGTLADSTDGVTGSRSWSFSAADKAFDYLAEGQTLTLVYMIQVDDHHGGLASQPVTITITGTNDAPQLAADVSGKGDSGLHVIPEHPGVTGDPTNDTAGGSLSFTDVDLSDTHTVGHSAPVFAWADAHGHPLSLTADQKDALTAASHLALTLHDSTGNGAGSIDFGYNAADSSFDFLAADETLTISYDVTVTDNQHASSTKTVTITVTGSNDAPVAVADSDTGHIVEAGNDTNDNILPGVATTTGNVLTNDTDVDITDTHEVVGAAAGTAGGVLSGNVGTAIIGTYGSLTLNADGTWTYTLDNKNPATDALVQGAHASDVFSYTESDHHGGTSTTTLTIDVTGANDAPTLAGVNAGSLVDTAIDDKFGSLTGKLDGHDVDSGETATLSYAAIDLSSHATNGAVTGLYGSLTVNSDGTYTYSPDAATINALSAGSYADTFTVQTKDVHGAIGTATLTIDVTGANDTPTLANANAGTLTDTAANDSFGNLTGQLAGNDRDSGETATLKYAALDASDHAVNTAVAGLYGSLTVHDDGTYTYTPDAAAINALPQGSFAETFTVETYDIHGATATATLTVDIVGANDTPTLAFKPTYLNFDGSTTAVGAVATANVGNGSDGVTLAGWVDWNGSGSAGAPQLLFYNGSTSDAGLGVNGVVTADGLLDLQIQNGGIAGIDTGIKIAPGTWHNIALTHVNGDFTLYVDGAAKFATHADVNAIPGSHADFTLIGGVSSEDGSSFAAEGFTGAIADVSVWNTALTQSQVQALQSTTLAGNESGLAAYFPLSDGSGTSVADLVDSAGKLTIDGNPAWVVNGSHGWPATGVSTVEGSPLSITGLSVSDVDIGSTEQITLKVGHGAVALASAVGVNVTSNGADGTLTFDGTVAAVDAALAGGVVYTPSSGYSGADTLHLSATDQGALTATMDLGINVTADAAPVINVDNLSVSGNANGTTAIKGLSVTDADAGAHEDFTLTTTTAGPGSSSDPVHFVGGLTNINSELASGLTYNEGTSPPSKDMVTIAVADSHGASDKVNLIFNVAQNPAEPVTLSGTSDKDVFFATGYHDKFVFAANSNHDTILNFTSGQDQIDLSAVVSVSDLATWFNAHVVQSPTNSADTLITIDSADTITVRNAILTKNDFIVHIT